MEFFSPLYSHSRHLNLQLSVQLLVVFSFLLFLFVFSVVGPAELMEPSETGGCPTLGCRGIGHFKKSRYLGNQRYVFATICMGTFVRVG